MKLAVITDEISQDFERALTVLEEYNIRSAELRGLWDTNVVDLSEHQIRQAKRLLEDKGISVCCIASPLFKCDLFQSESKPTGPLHLAKERSVSEQMSLLDHCAELADTFGTKLIRVFSFWRKGDLTQDVKHKIIEVLGNAARRAESLGVVICLENEHACYLGTGAETADVLRSINSPALRAVWDPGNAFCAGETPYPDGYEVIKPYLAHIHVKDVDIVDGKHQFVIMGTGRIDYKGQFEALKRDGYTGYISLETHYRPPSGSAEEGSRACLDYLRRVVTDNQ